MIKRTMGKLGLEVFGFGVGTMRLPTYEKDGKQVTDEEEGVRIIREAIDRGVNYIDGAYIYSNGRNEAIIGKALQDGYREKVYVATKFPVFRCKRKEDMRPIFEEQISALGVDCIDFYLLHGLNKNAWETVKEFGMLEFLDELKASGRIKYAAFSFHDSYEIFEEILNAYDWDMCQIQFNFMDVNNQAGMKGLKLAGERGIPVVIMEGLLGGKLAKAPNNVMELYKSFPIQRTPVEWAFRWLANLPEVSVVLSGVSSMEQMEDNVRIFNEIGVGCMSEEEIAFMDKVREAYESRTLVGCTGCRYCMPCPQGVEIPRIFATWNNAYQYGESVEKNSRYARMVREGQGADKCAQCGACEAVCPQHIEIIENLKKAHKAMG